MKLKIIELQKALSENINFIKQYHDVGKCHMVEFITANQWEELISPNDRDKVKNYCSNQDEYVIDEKDSSLTKGDRFCINDFDWFLKESSRLSVTKCAVVTTLSEMPHINQNGNNDIQDVPINSKEFMCMKKSHEVKYMSQLIVSFANSFGITDVLDIGSGKGYLGSYLSLSYGLHVTGVDCSDANSRNALTRAHKFTSYWKKLLKNKPENTADIGSSLDSQLRFVPKTALIDHDVDVKEFMQANDLGEESTASDVLICGLHACGDLSTSILRTFVANDSCKVACVVGCCYHHLSENVNDQSQGFPMSEYVKAMNYTFGRNTLMLSLRALEKTAAKSKEGHDKSERSLYYRALLTLILKEKFGISSDSKDVRIGGIFRKCNTFVEYIHRSMKCIKLTLEQQASITDEEIMKYHDKNIHHFENIKCFNILRSLFGSVVEHMILLDRLLYLLENGIKDTYLVKLFDPVLSPRCYAIVAWKEE